MTIYEKGKAYAKEQHGKSGQMYADQPYYEGHILPVCETGEQFLYLIPEKLRDAKMGGLACHDVIEDCGVTYNDVKKVLGEQAANWCYAMSTPKGKTREERHCQAYYDGIKAAGAEWDKLVDRYRNTLHSKENGNPQFGMYKKEYKKFKKMLQSDFTYAPLWHALDKLYYNDEEIVSNGIGAYSLVDHLETGVTYVIVGTHVKFPHEESILPGNYVPEAYFTCVPMEEMLQSEKEPQVVAKSAHEFRRHK